jgi:hypothetical protein
MGKPLNQFIFWAPRVAGIAFIAFLGLFAADVFGQGYDFLQTGGALLIHLIPNFVLLIVLIIAWKREWVGALVYTILGIAYIALGWGRMDWQAYFFISGPLFLTGLLFLLGWHDRKRKLIAPSPGRPSGPSA